MQNSAGSSAVLLLGRIITVIFVIGVILNMFYPLFENTYWNKNILQYAVSMFWLYGLLCNRGIIKRKISEDDGIIEYAVSVPIAQIGITRVIELLWFLFRYRSKVLWLRFIVLVVADVVYVMLQLLDKMNYCYIGIRENPDDIGEDIYAE